MKIDRLVGMMMILLDQKRIGAQELAELFEVSTRTVYRDIDAINRAGIPVRSVSGVGGGFEIMQNYKIDKKVFSAADLSAILMGLSNLSEIMRGDEVINALAKVRSFIPADRAKEIQLQANQICVDLSPWLGNRESERYLTTIKTALQEHRLLVFAYADRYGNKTERTVEPYQLVLKSSRWYFRGYCRIREDFRLFRLSRITDLSMKRETFAPREYQQPQPDAADFLAAVQTKIKIRIHQSIADRVLDYCASEDFSTDGGEHYTVRFPFVENEYYYGILLGFGDKCECLEPLRIRAEMKRRIGRIADLYKS